MPEGNPAWKTPTKETSEWAKRLQYDPGAEQRKYDTRELRKATYTTKTFWGREKSYDKDGNPIQDPSQKGKGWHGFF